MFRYELRVNRLNGLDLVRPKSPDLGRTIIRSDILPGPTLGLGQECPLDQTNGHTGRAERSNGLTILDKLGQSNWRADSLVFAKSDLQFP